MACEWWFYHLERPPLAGALAPLLEKCLERDWRVLVSSPDVSALSQLDKDLWRWKDDSFLPHGPEGEHSSRQPVLLSTSLENANDAKILVLMNGQDVETPDQPYQRIMVVFQSDDQHALQTARGQFKAARNAGLNVKYYQLSETGSWIDKTR
ncbi:DNA polymerase III subunit chi [Ponticaulis sp.]|jgi:DNA polymerase-3 subunit chi|uniref:DNA polymerase III subunit chi n=1 Tax=Ponticaulis sp. TaxID=2020902 RepID=UPI000C3EF5A6|nr:DNA polymerase III subunit chi [Ponticaulis sp.]MAF58752.1 DNA polymerase III subunit chi [Ponticaulis sp.]MAJ08463.1 DNA polymerase III subunit chi [Ponticaulis sp.]MBN04465.1 DNA polymerase III subunit chi [Ponticaulis sp.]HBJ92287.1 DNA polymerase III subunit chi [Hyphomonadaceae bacterium]|tara:strand:+ start:18579 stop:19034 length:456 start_codon:yes stop_codon:yes gene_type:complete